MKQEPFESFDNKEIEQEKQPKSHSEDETKKPDFFNELQRNEKGKGLAARGKGHNWTTFIEILMGDW